MIHEIGHALGLKHPHEPSELIVNPISANEDWYWLRNGTTFNPASGTPLEPDRDQLRWTVMSYKSRSEAWFWEGANQPDVFPQTPMWYDIQAIRWLYGEKDANVGDTVYKFTEGQKYFQTIVDDDGHSDEIVYVINSPKDEYYGARIDLRPSDPDAGEEHWSQLGAPIKYSDGGTEANNVILYRGTVIENATGGDGSNDTLIGNDADNVLSGRGGNDTLEGGAGNDTLRGGAGSDAASYATAIDSVKVNLGAATGTGGAGSDTLQAIENLIGSGFADELIGDGGPNVLVGGEGADTLRGKAGNDTFRFERPSEGKDIIRDFSSAERDQVAIFSPNFGPVASLSNGTLPLPNFIADKGANLDQRQLKKPNAYFLFNTTNDILYFDSDGAGTGATRVALAEIKFVTTGDKLSNTDIVLTTSLT